MVEISLSALIIAIKSIDRDIKAQEAALAEGRVNDDDTDETGTYVLDMQKVMSELLSTYKTACRDHPELSPLDTWLKAP
jgi:hypothetical protein